MSSQDPADETPQPSDPDPRDAELRQHLNEAFIEVNHGEYFRSRIRGWVAYRSDVDVRLPDEIAERLTSPFGFQRDEEAGDIATLDAFVIAYQAAESYWRYLLALYDGSGPAGVPLMAMAELEAGRGFNDRVSAVVKLPDPKLTELLDFLFLPPEVKDAWRTAPPSLESVQEYLRLWCRTLGRFVSEWRNPYNSAKHGLAVGARPTQFTAFASGGSPAEPVDLMDGPVLRTVEHVTVRDVAGKHVKDADRKTLIRWFWMHRAVDPAELIAQAIVTADLMDWLRAIARTRLLRVGGARFRVRSAPKPAEIRRRTAPGQSFRIPLAALPLPPDEAAALMSRLEQEEA